MVEICKKLRKKTHFFVGLTFLCVNVIERADSEARTIFRWRKFRYHELLLVGLELIFGMDVIDHPTIAMDRVLVVTTKENIRVFVKIVVIALKRFFFSFENSCSRQELPTSWATKLRAFRGCSSCKFGRSNCSIETIAIFMFFDHAASSSDNLTPSNCAENWTNSTKSSWKFYLK